VVDEGNFFLFDIVGALFISPFNLLPIFILKVVLELKCRLLLMHWEGLVRRLLQIKIHGCLKQSHVQCPLQSILQIGSLLSFAMSIKIGVVTFTRYTRSPLPKNLSMSGLRSFTNTICKTISMLKAYIKLCIFRHWLIYVITFGDGWKLWEDQRV